jgi:hypothetical protein
VQEKGKLERELANLIAEKARASADTSILSFHISTSQYSEEDVIALIKEKESMIKIYTRALFFSEIDRFNADRVAIIKAVMSQVSKKS